MENLHRIVFLDISTVGKVNNLFKLKELGTFTTYELTPPEERISRISGHDIVITNKVIIDAAVMDACPELKLICIAATGMNNVDLDHAARKGIAVKNVAGYSTESVAQSTFSMLFYLLHKTAYFDQYVKSGNYAHSPIFTHYGRTFWELKGKRIGIIGLGTIGGRVAELFLAFGCDVVYYSTSGKNFSEDYRRLSLQELLSTSDIVSIHCPLNEKTQDLIGAKELQLMKPSAFLINAGRGGIVNEGALSMAIDKGWISGAAVDVLTREPISSDNPLLTVDHKDRLLIMPHVAWASIESRELLVDKLADNIRTYISDQER